MRECTKLHPCAHLQLEHLEARDCPVFSIHYTSAVLLIQGRPTYPFVQPGDGLQVTYSPVSNLVQVDEVSNGMMANFYGRFRPPRTIIINLYSNTDHDLTVDLGGGRLTSNLLVNLGYGNTDVLSPHFNNIINGTLGGNLTILGGVGGELIPLGDFAGTKPVVIQGDTNLVLGNQQTPLGGDFLFVNAGSQLLGRLASTDLDNIQIGELIGAPSVVRKDVSLNVARSGNVGKIDVVNGEVDGNVFFQGSPVIEPGFSDSVIIGEIGGPTATVFGSVIAAFGNGSGDFHVNSGSTVRGSVSLTGGLGDDEVTLDGTVFGSVQMNLRSGDNMVEFNPAAIVFGNLSISADNGNNDLSNFAGTVFGNLTFHFGNGNDTVTIANAPGGRLIWTSGNGNDSLTLAPISDNQFWNVCVRFGNGDDTFNLAGIGMNETVSGLVDGGGSISGNVFNQNANWTLAPTFILSNFP